MKASELQIGDYVGVCVGGADAICKVDQIRPDGASLLIVDAFPFNKNDDKSMFIGQFTYRRVEDIHPLPLTEWVLEYNRFPLLYEKETKDDSISMWILNEDNGHIGDLLVLEFFYARPNEYDNVGTFIISLVHNPRRSVDGEYTAINFITRLKYIHEFQHLLKVLGIEKKITIKREEQQ